MTGSDLEHLTEYTMAQQQINLYIDIISPFGYMANYMLRVSHPYSYYQYIGLYPCPFLLLLA